MLSANQRDAIENAFGYFPDDVSPLSQAILCDDLEAVEAALAAGADANQREPGGLTPILVAAAISRDAALRSLLRANGDPNSFEGDTHKLALSYALSAGLHGKDWRGYYTLLDNGADVNFARHGGSTIAEWAISLGRFDKLLELLDRGYRYDLAGLAKSIEVRKVSAAAEAVRGEARTRVRALIAEQQGEPAAVR